MNRSQRRAQPEKPVGFVFENAEIVDFLNKITPEAREILLREAMQTAA